MRRQTEPPIMKRDWPGVMAAPAPSPDAIAEDSPDAEADVVLDDLLVEDVSIDGMCGVY